MNWASLHAAADGWLRPQAGPADHVLVRWLFLRALGIVYFAAFASLATQIAGLVGENGLLPVKELFAGAQAQLGPEARWTLPSVFWYGHSDAALEWACWIGAAVSLLVVAGPLTGPALAVLWVLYLSLETVCQDFLGFQWDLLLLETGFLAMFFAPWSPRAGVGHERRPSFAMLFLLRWLLFRLMFSSGVVKLLSGDATWWGLTALEHHYETQPLPTVLGWWAHQLPQWMQSLSVLAVFAIEVPIPFLVFGPRKARLFAFGAFVLLQVLILLTGNYCYFNWLTLALSLLLLDDRAARRLLPARLLPACDPETPRAWEPPARRALQGAIFVIVLALGMAQMSRTTALGFGLPEPARQFMRLCQPLYLVNTYGLFAVMTTVRNEIVIEGSDDAKSWKEYEFRYKPGDPRRRPRFVAPHQPRLDWQMWFAALSDIGNNPWFGNLLIRLLQGEPTVLALLEHNPFPDRPPKLVRALVYQYHFSDPSTLMGTGAWWTRELKGRYCPAVRLQ